MSGPAPKPAHLRQRTNKKAGYATLMADAVEDRAVPEIPNPDERVWHPLTLEAWQEAWKAPMADLWLDSDVTGLGQLAILWDEFYKKPSANTLAEIRLQRQCFGLTPLDRTRLQWEVKRTEDAERKQSKPEAKRPATDPRSVLMAVS